MHPIVKGFIDSISISRDSVQYLRSIEEIRESTCLALVIRDSAPSELDLLSPLTRILETLEPGSNLDFLLCAWGSFSESEKAVLRCFKERGLSYSTLMTTPRGFGFPFSLGAKELVLGDRAGFRPFQGSFQKGKKTIQYSALEAFEKFFPEDKILDRFPVCDVLPLLARADHERNKLSSLLELRQNALNFEKSENLIENYLQPPLGPDIDLDRRDLSSLGLSVMFAEHGGILGTLTEMEGYYRSMIQLSTILEGMHQTHAQAKGEPDTPSREIPFKARAELLAIVESVKTRFLCFRISNLPPDGNDTIVWAEKL
jgi:hypothetical protein